MTERKIGVVPVVDAERRPIGIITESNLFVENKRIPYIQERAPALFGKFVNTDNLAEAYSDAGGRTAADAMTSPVICVEEDDTVSEVARLMTEKGIGRVPVVRGGLLTGIVARTDLLRTLIVTQ
jgi:CBS domain-containing protein